MSATDRGRPSPDSSAAVDGERIVDLRIAASPERLKLVRALVRAAATACGCGDECARDVVIAVDEACQNIIRHAYGEGVQGDILIGIRRERDRIALDIVDFAPPVDPDMVKPRALEELRPGGLGTHFISECMDQSEFRTPPEGAGNRLWMAKRIE